MKITFEFNNDEKHLVSYCIRKCIEILGCSDGNEDPFEYEYKRTISNVFRLIE